MGFDFDLALNLMRSKTVSNNPINWRNSWNEAKQDAFWVAGITNKELLTFLHESIVEAIDNGETYEEWRKKVLPRLEGQISPARLRTIFMTNVFTVQSADRYITLKSMADDDDYWQYVTVDDDRVRPSHAILHNKVFHHSDVFWDTHYPPNGFNCRCVVVTRDSDDIERLGLTVETGADHITMKKDPRGGEIAVYVDPEGRECPTDPGWGYNPGKFNRLSDLDRESEKKLKKAQDRSSKAIKGQDKNTGETPAKPAKPARATRSAKRAKSAAPAEPATPAIPAEPIKPAKPAKSTRTTSAAKPTAPVGPVAPAIPAEPVKPAKPARATRTTRAAKPSAPVGPAVPAEPVKPAKPARATRTTRAAKPAAPVEPVTPAVPAEPVKPVKPARATRTTRSAKPATPTGPVAPAVSSESDLLKKAAIGDSKVLSKSLAKPAETKVIAPVTESKPTNAKGSSLLKKLAIGAAVEGLKKKKTEAQEQDKSELRVAIPKDFDIDSYSIVTKEEDIKYGFQRDIREAELEAQRDIKRRLKNEAAPYTVINFSNRNFTIEQFEEHVREKEVEYLLFVDRHGVPIVATIGIRRKSSILEALRKYSRENGISLEDLLEGGTLTHNHPGADSTFSAYDLTEIIYDYKLSEVRVVTTKSLYRFRPNEKFFREDKDYLFDTIFDFLDDSILKYERDSPDYLQRVCELAYHRSAKFLANYGEYERVERKNH